MTQDNPDEDDSPSKFEDFEWDERKARDNISKHGIDFIDACAVFEGIYVRWRLPRAIEARWMAVGLMHGIEIAVVYTVRQRNCRLISARRAHSSERRKYHSAVGIGDTRKDGS